MRLCFTLTSSCLFIVYLLVAQFFLGVVVNSCHVIVLYNVPVFFTNLLCMFCSSGNLIQAF